MVYTYSRINRAIYISSHLFKSISFYKIRSEMTKRAASYDIDPVTFEEKERTDEKDNPIDPQGAHMKNRKIFKLSRNQAPKETNQTSRPTLSIPGLLDNQAEGNKPESKESTKPTSSIFGSSLFGSSSAGSGLFSNLFSNIPASTGRTEAQTKEGTVDIQKAKQSIFGTTSASPLGSGSIFGNNSASLFGKSLFSSNISQGQGLFSIKPKTNDEEGEDQGDSAQLQRNQSMASDPSKSVMNFSYNEECSVLKKVKLAKFKKDKGDLIDTPLTVSLLQDKDNNSKTSFLVIQLDSTHKNIFSGVILPGKSQTRILNSKSENVEITAFTISKAKMIEKHVIRLQIINDKEGDDVQFFEALKQVIEGVEIKEK